MILSMKAFLRLPRDRLSVKQPLSAFPKLFYPLSHFQVNLTLNAPTFLSLGIVPC